VLLNEGEALTREMLQIPGHAGSPEMEAAPAQALASLREILEKGIPEDGVDYEHLVGSVEKLLITRAAEKARWNQSQVARYLHLNRDKLRTRLKNFGLGRG
jgi:DNA-binding NtrC family response regulator